MRRATATALALGAAALPLAGCGSGDDAGGGGAAGGAERSNRLVDFAKDPPYVNTLEVDPRTKEFLLTTNRGFFRISPDGEQVARVEGKVSSGTRVSPVGTFLEIELGEREGVLIGSGHPDDATKLPQFLGFLRSEDSGRTWRVVSRLGDADLHKIVRKHDRVYAFDAVLGAMLITEDEGRTFEERFTPRGLIIDFEVDPQDPERIVVANERELFRSDDGGRRWRALAGGEGIRLAWPAPDALYRAAKDGEVEVSRDGGGSFAPAGEVPGEPYELRAVGRDELHAVLSDGTILHTTDGAKSWEAVFNP